MRPGMSDGRAFTNWESSCQMNASIQEKQKLANDSLYREWLQKNASAIMNAQNVLKK